MVVLALVLADLQKQDLDEQNLFEDWGIHLGHLRPQGLYRVAQMKELHHSSAHITLIILFLLEMVPWYHHKPAIHPSGRELVPLVPRRLL